MTTKLSADSFAADLELYGPDRSPPTVLSPRQSRRYCRRLAQRHYENFSVLTFFLPGHLRQHIANLYAYCRWADDLADETGDPARSLALLRWWETQLHECYQGRAQHPVFVALGETIRQFDLPPEPLVNLLVAFRQDQRTTRYQTLGQVLEYCRYSANPVGRLVLYLGRCFSEPRARLSDAICTGLQLANFCQDVARDWERGRIYLPQTDLHRFGYDEAQFAARTYNEPFRHLLACHVQEAEAWLRRGLPLVNDLSADLRLPVALFAMGGLAILAAVRRQNYDVWSRRPTLARGEKLRIMARTWWRLRRGTLLDETPA